ncbi:MAG: LysM peptidoglycan-binding domain-containing protein [Ardenticatenaceae bacterium]|nr:LysM peptidoglycan-binding domain-containing protein [Ardenticatenaceae bacterium]
MRYLSVNVKLLLFAALALLVLVACERPVPGSESVDATATPAVLLPTVPATDGGLVQPTAVPADNPTPDPAYPAPGEGESGGEGSSGETGGGETDGGESSGGETGGSESSGGESSGGTGATPTTYTVQAGDTLYTIALKYGLTVQELATANNITNVDSLSVGDTLTIPAPGTVTDDQQGGGQPSTGEQIHTVAPGENLFRIGLRYGFTVAELASYNNIANPNSIAVGQQIRIPAR